ncbi:MAG: hypothetical protein MK297_04770 [Planctomycetes bacterium]|nr:hypothetical protein [Planctomycetota bacterium]
MGFELAGLVWERPQAWWGLCLPLLVLLAAKQPLRPRQMATGALSLWKRVMESPGAGGSERPAVPWAIWLLCAGLTAAVLSMAGPRSVAPGASREWVVLVDRSPSSYLPAEDASDEDRLARGIKLLEEEWLGLLREGDRVRWFDGQAWEEGMGFPDAWRDAPRAPMLAPDWTQWDAPGCVWLCARPPAIPRAESSLCSGGGAAAPGPVAIDGEDRLDWDGAALVRVIGGAPRRTVRLDGVGGALADLVALWADERGLVLSRGAPSPEDVLVLSRAGDAGSRSEPGALSVLESEEEYGARDPAEFALLWSERLDEACLPAAGLSPVSARAPIGNAIWIQGAAPDERRDGGRPGRAWEGWLALLSCGLVAAALIGTPR